MNVALSNTWRDLESQAHPPWKNRYRCNQLPFPETRSSTIPTATATFSTTTDLDKTTSTSRDDVDYRFKMVATKPEVEITFERQKMAPRFQLLPPHIFGPDRLGYDTVDIVHHCPTLVTLADYRIHNGGHRNRKWK